MAAFNKTVVTITGIRPDFIRMAEIFRKLDQNFHHILIHTGQHYDKLLSDVFFEELEIRRPDYILNTGSESSNHFEQLSYLSREVPNLFKTHNIKPDLILFLGDSNTSGVAFPLKKEGYKIGHIEAGMRSFDKRMLEEINRTVCDHCSDILFVYHDEYKRFLEMENIRKNVYVVGNTIVEVAAKVRDDIFATGLKREDMILIDIHRPENFKYRERMEKVIEIGNHMATKYSLPVKILYFKRLEDNLKEWGLSLGAIEMIPLMSYKKYLTTIYHCKFIISDSGTGQEEPALFGTKVLVPRDFTERPQSYEGNCSKYLNLNLSLDDCTGNGNLEECLAWVEDKSVEMDLRWLGEGKTADLVIDGIKHFLGVNPDPDL